MPHSCLQKQLHCCLERPLWNREQTIFSKDREKQPVKRILELYACRFEMDSDNVREVASTFEDAIKHKCSLYKKKMAGSD
jgi:hypothetical protein